MSRESTEAGDASRPDDLLTLARLSVGPEAVRAILDWLGQRTGGTVLLVNTDGKTLAGPVGPVPPEPQLLRAVGVAVPDVHRRGPGSAVLDTDGPATLHVVPLPAPGPGPQRSTPPHRSTPPQRSAPHRTGPPTPPRPSARREERIPYLVVVAARGSRHGELLADAARTLSLCWRLAEADRIHQRIVAADAHGREAVLHLLMVGEVPAARRIASALRPQLPDALRVCVIECAGRDRYEVAAELEGSLSGRAWIVPCPVRANHLIALAPADPPDDDTGPAAPEDTGRASPVDRLGQRITRRAPGCRVGISQPVALRDTATGYEQAFHALAVARADAGGYARFDRRADLGPLLGLAGHAWADAFLRPCLRHIPGRRADPGPAELLGTLSSWLAFDQAASRHLKIHRNTLAGRLRLLDGLLGLDLHRARDQSAAYLALRLHGVRHPAPSPGGSVAAAGPPARPEGVTPSAGAFEQLEHLLAAPAVATWARSRLHPLDRTGRPALTETVRTWLDADTSLAVTARTLSISVPATRKRLHRAEEALGRALLAAPSARHELWLAMRALGMVRR